MAGVIGIGGVFLRVPDVGESTKWYAEVLGLDLQSWGGAVLQPPAGGQQVFSLFREDTEHFKPSTHPAMVNLTVDDLDAVLARAAAHGVQPLSRTDGDAHGRFAWLLDPAGFKVELWEPPAEAGG